MCIGFVGFEKKNKLCINGIIVLNYYYSPDDFDTQNPGDKIYYLI